MTQNNDHDFQQFRGQFDDAMIPDASFKIKMENLLQSEKPIEDDRKSTVLASPSRQQSETVVPGRRSHPLMIAVAVLMVFAVVISSVWVLSGDVLEGEYASAPSGIATLPADAPGTPGMDVGLTPSLIEGTGDIGMLVGIFDGIAIYQTVPETGPPQGLVRESGPPATPEPSWFDRSLVAFDLQSGKRLWEKQNTTADAFQYVDGKLIRLDFEMTGYGEVHSRVLTAIDLRGGEELWEASVPDTPLGIINSSGWLILLVQGLVVLPDVNGVIWAWDVKTGELAWEGTFDPGVGHTSEWQAEDGSRTTTFRDFAATVWNDHIVIINDYAMMQVLNPDDGSNVTSYNLMSTNPEEFPTMGSGSLAIHSMPSHVVLMRSIPSSDGQRSEAVALDPLTGDIVWSQQFEGIIGAPSVSADGTMAINAGKWHQNNWLLQLIGQSGYSTNQFFWYDGETGMEILSTERTRSSVYSFAVTNGQYACIRTEITEIVCLDRVGARHIIEIELAGPMIFEDNVLYIPTQSGLYRAELP